MGFSNICDVAARWLGLAILPQLLVLTLSGASAKGLVVCPNHANVSSDKYCPFFIKYPSNAIPSADWRLEDDIPRENPDDPPIRSIALIVDVNHYPKLPEHDLPPVKNDLHNLIPFLNRQGFDEIIVLENEDATKENIDYFLDDYLPKELKIYGVRSRVLFAFSGHGDRPDAPSQSTQPGSLVLSGYGNSTDLDQLYPLAILTPRLINLASLSHHFVALLGSCYSGGIFPPVSDGNNTLFYYSDRGAHAMSATTSNALAFAIGKNKGTLFFDNLIEGVNTGIADTEMGNGIFVNNVLHLQGGGIVRLGSLASYLSARLIKTPIPPEMKRQFPGLTKLPEIRVGALESGEGWDGAFFFLGPPKTDSVIAAAIASNAPTAISVCDKGNCSVEDNTSEIRSLGVRTTGSSVFGHPDIAIFNSPASYKIAGVDVSHWNSKIDWMTLAAHRGRISFAYVKGSEGANFKDPQFDENWQGAKQAGLKRGAYHVLNLCKTADEQFKFITGVVPKDRDALPIAVDLEWDDGPRNSPQSRCNDIDKIRSMLHDLLIRLEKYYGKIPVIHASASGVGAILNSAFYRYPLWLEGFQKSKEFDKTLSPEIVGPRLPGENPWTIWQVSATGRVPGATQPITIDVFFGNEGQLAAFAGSGMNEGRVAVTRLER
jgi:GH25 family lysozyme M1 (1,4-beta-N-acetylmuramidase)